MKEYIFENAEKLKLAKNDLFQKYPIRTLALFGSYAINEQTAGSDIDILVDVEQILGVEFMIRFRHILVHNYHEVYYEII